MPSIRPAWRSRSKASSSESGLVRARGNSTTSSISSPQLSEQWLFSCTVEPEHRKITAQHGHFAAQPVVRPGTEIRTVARTPRGVGADGRISAIVAASLPQQLAHPGPVRSLDHLTTRLNCHKLFEFLVGQFGHV